MPTNSNNKSENDMAKKRTDFRNSHPFEMVLLERFMMQYKGLLSLHDYSFASTLVLRRIKTHLVDVVVVVQHNRVV